MKKRESKRTSRSFAERASRSLRPSPLFPFPSSLLFSRPFRPLFPLPSSLFPALLLLACSGAEQSANATSTAPPPAEEIVSFSLRRAPVALTFNENAELLAIVDPEVVRLLDATGFELWGRRLDIGPLFGAAFCGGGLVVWGEEGWRTLNLETGLVEPGGSAAGRVLSVAGDEDFCAFLEEERLRVVGRSSPPREIDLSPGGRILAKAGDGWLVGGRGLLFFDKEGARQALLPETEPVLSLAVRGARVAVLSTKLRLFSHPEKEGKGPPLTLLWERALGEEGLAPGGSVPLRGLLPLGFWSGQVIHGASGLALYDPEGGAFRWFSGVDPKGAPITALSARDHRLALVYSDGTVALWEGAP